MKIRTIIVDDEVLAIDILEDYISKFPFLELIGKFDSAFKAVKVITSEKIDLVFLDINMPDLDGISFYENLPIKPKVIFTTAYSEFAVKGFEINAIDYLLKPISFNRFFKAVTKVRVPSPDPYSEFSFNPNIPALSKGDSGFIFVKVEHSSIKINFRDIIYLEGYKDYVKIHLQSESNPILTLSSVKHYEESLFSKGFVRVHKRFIVSIDKIENISRNKIKLANIPVFITIGDSYKEFFYELVVRKNL